jgi:type 1 fimbria pilin
MKRLILSVAIALALAVASPVFAQVNRAAQDNANTRSVQGTVADTTNKPVDGAVVQLKDTKTLQIRSFITKGDGLYHFHGLSSNVDYELRADHQGSSSSNKTLSSFDDRKQAVVNLKLDAKK